MNLLKTSLIIALISCFAFANTIQAQKGLEIKKVFDKYGEQKGVTMVELTDEMLDGYDLSFFKSIIIENNSKASDFIRECLSMDEKGARKVKQVVANGVPTSIYLQLPEKGKIYRLILFNETFKPEHKTTLIYIESKNNSEDILKLILKKN
jgi:hypothetical protein